MIVTAAFEQELTNQFSVFLDAMEAQLNTGRLVDPLERLIGDDGEIWDLVNGVGANSESCAPYETESELTNVRKVCRALAKDHPFAICGHENRVNYIVGEGHIYTATAKPRMDVSEDNLEIVQDIIDQFCELNRWHSRQQESLLRTDRDGETFLRVFPGDDGYLRVRFVEPAAVFQPDDKRKPEFSFGIETDPDDTETVLAYWVNGEPIDAGEIQHRKRGLDSSCKRGIPVFWSVRQNLIRASKILRNGSSVTEFQTAIGMIRRHIKATGATVSAWVNSQANIKQQSDSPGFGTNGTNSRIHQQYGPASILDASAGTEYEFPAMGVDPSRYIESLQAELRAVAARLVMPEFMFTAKSDDVNRAAAFAAEGPSTKMFRRLQWHEITFDKEILNAQLDLAVAAKLLKQDLRDAVTVDIQPPTIVTRDPRAEAEVRQLDMNAGILSVQTATAAAGWNYQQEQANIEAHDEAQGKLPGNPMAPPLPPAPGESDDDDENADES